MAYSTAVLLEHMNQNLEVNVHTSHEASIDLKTKLVSWREGFFDLLDTTDADHARIYQWIVPTLALENELSSFQKWQEVDALIDILHSTLIAFGWDDYTPAAPLQASVIALYNTVWAAA
jgi:hypothetical protein